ncbi:MAG TPA: transcription antitermination factor NusB [Saprospiraceae bacterium]|nr:transcription antitermination factor NusB [Saprospiraceae bacterium]
MLSRRNVRVKVMQRLYSLNQDKELSFNEVLKAFHNSINEAFQLYLLNLACLIEVCSMAEEDAKTRLSKHIKSPEDRAFTDKLYSNSLIHSLVQNKELQKDFKNLGLDYAADKDMFRKIYKEFSKEAVYSEYIQNPNTENEQHVEILLELYRCCRKNSIFNEIMDDRFAGWTDDKSLVIGILKKTLKELPAEGKFYQTYRADDDTVYSFGEFLIKKTYEESQQLEELITPFLENWDSDRLALVDMILIKMAIIELKYFTSIPTKVTLNEYVELSKMYSTDKSKEFVNGVLDKILKDLQDKGLVQKEGRGLVD